MAELAIPLIALGGLFITSNSKTPKRERKIEGYKNLNNNNNGLSKHNANSYSKGINQPNDKYFNPDNFNNVQKNNSSHYGVGGNTKQQYSLTGEPILTDKFTHNNMVPFFGARVKGATSDRNVAEGILDNMVGTGYQQIVKQEQAPLFAPQCDLQYAFGAPNNSDFIQSRVNPSLKMANVKPWEEIHVAPGLDKGYNSEGGAGFNSGIEARDKWLPKTVNELRVANNPKTTFGLSGHEGPAVSYTNGASIQTQGIVEKHTPEGFYTSGPERWFTNVGDEKASAVRSTHILPDVNRTTATSEYFGNGKNSVSATYTKGEYKQPVKQELSGPPILNPSAKGSCVPTSSDYGMNSYSQLPNNRSTTNTNMFGAVSGVFKAAISPLMDIMRPSRKENVIGNIRPYGNVAGTTVSNPTVRNPADKTRTTVREMTERKLDNNHLNVQGQSSNAYMISQYPNIEQERDTTTCSYSGVAGPSGYSALKSYEAEYNQHNNNNKTFENHPNMGGTQLLSNVQNVLINRTDADRNNNRLWVPGSMSTPGIINTPSASNIGSVQRKYEADDLEYTTDRMKPDILNAFKNNPYTQSLSSW